MMQQYTQLTAPIYPDIPLIPGSAEAEEAIREGRKRLDTIVSEYWDWKWNRPGRMYGDINIPFQGFLQRASNEYLTDCNHSNQVFSPFCLYHGLLFIANLCGGDTQKELLQLLGSMNIAELNDAFSSLLANSYHVGGYTVSSSASLWLDHTVDVNKQHIQDVSQQFLSPVFSGNMGDDEYQNAMRSWLNQVTDGKLSDNISEVSIPDDAKLVLMTALRFQAKWVDQFDPDDTETGIFHGTDDDISCEYMHMTAQRSMWFGEGFTGLHLPFDEVGSIWFILPDEGKMPEDILRSGSLMLQYPPQRTNRSLQQREVVMSIPKCEVSSSIQMIEGLKRMGVNRIFTDKSQTPYTHFNGRMLKLEQVQHDTHFKVE